MQRRLVLRTLAVAGTLALPVYFSPAAMAAGDDALVALLHGGGHLILMRHAATVPGVGDPTGFVLGQCGTQRNLSEAGRADARRVGAAFVRHRIPVAAVLSSRWCRCLDTARLAFGTVAPAPMLDSMFDEDGAARDARLRQLPGWIKALPRDGGNVVLVTHDVNIQALVQQSVRQGEMVVAKARPDGALDVVGSWRV